MSRDASGGAHALVTTERIGPFVAPQRFVATPKRFRLGCIAGDGRETHLTEARGTERVMRALARERMLLVTDPVLPSVSAIVAGEPVRGSWWSHAAAREIFAVVERLVDRERVLLVKLLSKKQTFLHDDLRDDFLAVASARESWQTRALPAAARALLERVERDGAVRLDEVGARDPLALRRAARELEARLLVLGESVHTATGAHQKRLSSWESWARANGVSFSFSSRPGRRRVEASKRVFEDLVAAWRLKHGKKPRLPWPIAEAARPPRHRTSEGVALS